MSIQRIPPLDSQPVTRKELQEALQETKTEIFTAMSEEFLQISQHMMTKEDGSEMKGMLVDVLAQLQSQQDNHVVEVHQQQRTTDKVEEHDTRLLRVERKLGFM